MAAPKWAQDLVLKVLEDEGCEDVPDLQWHRSRKYFSSGHCSRVKIHVTAGARKGDRWYQVTRTSPWKRLTARQEQKMVLLHEIAHWLVPPEKQTVTDRSPGQWYDQDGKPMDAPTYERQIGHSARFWDKAWELFHRYKPAPIRYIKMREGNYRAGALAAYRRSR